MDKHTTYDRLEPGVSKPVMIVGSATKVEGVATLTAPVTKKDCVYYQVKCEREEEHERYAVLKSVSFGIES